MPQHRDQYELVTRLLGEMGLAEKWRVVEPVRGDIKNYVRIQNAIELLEASVNISARGADVLANEEMTKQIQDAIDAAHYVGS